MKEEIHKSEPCVPKHSAKAWGATSVTLLVRLIKNYVIDFRGCAFLTAICPLKENQSVSSDAVLQLGSSLLMPRVCLGGCVGIKVAVQHSRVKFNLLSQKAFNPFHSVILLILVPKWHHLEEKSALSHTNTIKLAIGLRPLLFECHITSYPAANLDQCICCEDCPLS